jgi:hypothetical protein
MKVSAMWVVQQAMEAEVVGVNTTLLKARLPGELPTCRNG